MKKNPWSYVFALSASLWVLGAMQVVAKMETASNVSVLAVWLIPLFLLIAALVLSNLRETTAGYKRAPMARFILIILLLALCTMICRNGWEYWKDGLWIYTSAATLFAALIIWQLCVICFCLYKDIFHRDERANF